MSLHDWDSLGIMAAIILALVGGFWISSVCAYDQFEGYDLSDPYPETRGWYRVDDQRREDRRDFEERQRYDERDNYNPYIGPRRFELELEDMRYE